MPNYLEQQRFESAIDILMEHFRETEERMAALEEQIEALRAQLNANAKDSA
jgi:uncharacterized small protein (DUF1192 family)